MSQTVERKKIKVQYQDQHGRWHKAEGFYPKEWLCANPKCNKITRTRQRSRNNGKDTLGAHCSCRCRVEHELLIKKQLEEEL